MDEFKAYCYSLEEMAAILKLSVATLRRRIYTRTKVPPFQNPGRGVYWFPKAEFVDWCRSKPLSYESDHAS